MNYVLHTSCGRRTDAISILAQKRLRDLKSRISAQSKRNFVLERDVRYLDSRIALLIQNRMALDEVRICAPFGYLWMLKLTCFITAK